mmetsp:Transcript_37231/g.69314  ORF Transcript_37231/g.69314 Transcript_37231/m.69314 type:complete len:233 (+) Transcript_37231:393-1091(+)
MCQIFITDVKKPTKLAGLIFGEARERYHILLLPQPLGISMSFQDSHHFQKLRELKHAVIVVISLGQDPLGPLVGVHLLADLWEQLFEEGCKMLILNGAGALRVELSELLQQLFHLRIREAFLLPVFVTGCQTVSVDQPHEVPHVNFFFFNAGHEVAKFAGVWHMAKGHHRILHLRLLDDTGIRFLIFFKDPPDHLDVVIAVSSNKEDELALLQHSRVMDIDFVNNVPYSSQR